MATIKAHLAMVDGMTGPIRKIHSAMTTLINSFESMQDISSRAIDTASLQKARDLAADSVAEWDRMADSVRGAGEAQEEFNKRLRAGGDAANDLGGKLKGVLATVMSIAGVKSSLGWVKENLELADTQRNAENQLKAVLANMGVGDVEVPSKIMPPMPLDAGAAADPFYNYENTLQTTLNLDTREAIAAALEYDDWANKTDKRSIQNSLALDGVNTAIGTYNDFINTVDGNTITAALTVDTTQTVKAFDAIAAKASEIQGKGIYGDEAMIAGAAEFATYFSDAEAIMSMMDTLANYSMGMSGGGALDSAAMVQYATNLGKIMTGSYDAMTKKGFEFTEAQKAIIEGTATEAQIVETLGAEYLSASADMQAAAAINSVIAESWNGLYEVMSNTPEGKIIQFNNKLGDLRENLGNQLYPAVIHFFDVFTEKFPQVEQVMGNLASACSVLIGILTAAAVFALNTATAISDNWGWLKPIILGVAGAYLILHGAMIAYNTVQAISNGIQAISAANMAWKTSTTLADVAATKTATGAQVGLNAAMLACPITWIIGGIIAIIALFYAGVGAVNHFAGTSVSATGLIAGAFAVLGAHIANTFFIPTWNYFAAIANFIGNVFNDPVAAVKVLFYDMALTVIGYISNMAHAIEDVINKIPGVSVDITSGLDSFYNGLEDAQQKVKDESGWVEYVQKKDFIDYGDAAKAGYNFGAGIEDKVSSLFDFGTLDTSDFASMMDGIYGNTGDTAANTAATVNALDYTEEDLKYMRDIAEREAINRFTTAEINVDMTNHNNISSGMDLDGVIDGLTDRTREAIDIIAEGVHE